MYRNAALNITKCTLNILLTQFQRYITPLNTDLKKVCCSTAFFHTLLEAEFFVSTALFHMMIANISSLQLCVTVGGQLALELTSHDRILSPDNMVFP